MRTLCAGWWPSRDLLSRVLRHDVLSDPSQHLTAGVRTRRSAVQPASPFQSTSVECATAEAAADLEAVVAAARSRAAPRIQTAGQGLIVLPWSA